MAAALEHRLLSFPKPECTLATELQQVYRATRRSYFSKYRTTKPILEHLLQVSKCNLFSCLLLLLLLLLLLRLLVLLVLLVYVCKSAASLSTILYLERLVLQIVLLKLPTADQI